MDKKLLVSADDIDLMIANSEVSLEHVKLYNKLVVEWKKKNQDLINMDKGDNLWVYILYDAIFNAGYLQAVREKENK